MNHAPPAQATARPGAAAAGWREFAAYERFSRSHHWLPGAAQGERSEPPSAAFARACAGAVVRYWEIGLAAGAVDPAREVVVLEPDAGCGHFTWLMLAALRESLADSLCAGLQVRYVACVAEAGHAARVRLEALRLATPSPELVVETALWRQGGDGPRARGGALDFSGNPPAILAYRYFGGLVQDLFRRRRGHLFEGLLAQRPRGERLAYRWRGIAEADWLSAGWRDMLAPGDGAAPRLFPSGALRSLDRIARLARQRYLLLAVERDGAGAAPRAWPADSRFPVDLACLADYQAGLGAQVWNGWRGSDGLRALAVLRDDANPARRETLDAVVAGLRERAPDDHLHLAAILRAAAHALEPARVLALLRLSGFDPGVLEAGLEVLERDPAAWDEPTRRDARAALARVWANHLPRAGQGGLGPRLAELAVALDYWGLAKSILRMEVASRDAPAPCLLRLAACEAETGESAEALAHAEEAIRRAPAAAATRAWLDEAAALRDRLAARLRAWADLPWYRPESARDGDLRIEPAAPERPGTLLVLHECRGRLGTLDFQVVDGEARFRLCRAAAPAEPADLDALARLLAHVALAGGAHRQRIELAPADDPHPRLEQPFGERDEPVQKTPAIDPGSSERRAQQDGGGG